MTCQNPPSASAELALAYERAANALEVEGDSEFRLAINFLRHRAQEWKSDPAWDNDQPDFKPDQFRKVDS